MCCCSSTEAEAEIKDEHWHVEDQPQAPGDCKLMATRPCMCLLLKCAYMQCLMLCFLKCHHMLFLLRDIQCKGAYHAVSIFCRGESSSESAYPCLTCMHSHGISAGTVPKYPLHYWKHFFTGPATRRKGVLLTMALAGSVVVTMAFAASQHQLASQLYSMAL